MSTPEHVEIVDVLLVEDDPGDVLLIEEAFADNKVHNRLHTVSDAATASHSTCVTAMNRSAEATLSLLAARS